MTKHKDEPKAPAKVPETERYEPEACPPDHPAPPEAEGRADTNEPPLGEGGAEGGVPETPAPDHTLPEPEDEGTDTDPGEKPVDPNTVGGGAPFVPDTRTIAEQLAALTPGVG